MKRVIANQAMKSSLIWLGPPFSIWRVMARAPLRTYVGSQRQYLFVCCSDTSVNEFSLIILEGHKMILL